MYGGPLFSPFFKKNLRIQNDQKLITDSSIFECLHLIGPEVNFSFDVWKILELFYLVLRLLLRRSAKYLRRSGMYQSWIFFSKIGHAKFVGFRFSSGIWRSESRISSRYLEITPISLIYSVTYSRKKGLACPGLEPTHLCDPFRSEETLSWGISRLRHCNPR